MTNGTPQQRDRRRSLYDTADTATTPVHTPGRVPLPRRAPGAALPRQDQPGFEGCGGERDAFGGDVR